MDKFLESSYQIKNLSKSPQVFKIGTPIKWKWLGRSILGQVVEVHFIRFTKLIKEKNITRNGTKDNPAYLVQSQAGNLAIKLQSELELIENDNSLKVKPRIFSGS